MKTLKVFILAILGFISLSAKADKINLTASAPGVVSAGEQFRLAFSINGKPSKFNPPKIKDFDVLMGPSTSSSSNVSIINGKMTQSYNYTYTYVLRARKEGKFTIPKASAEYEGKNYESNELKIEVVKASARKQQQQQGRRSNTAQQSAQIKDKDLYVRIHLNRKNIYQGEAIVATAKIYTRVDLSGFEKIDYPDFKGFLKQDVETPPLTHLNREVINGEIYNTGVLQKFLLIPQRSGKIDITPANLVCNVRQQVNRRGGSIFDEFFGGYKTARVQIYSKALSVNVKELPDGKPDNFTGAVGDFSFSAKLDKNTAKVNDAITLKVSVKGTGNLKLIDELKPNFPPDFEVYDPKLNQNIKSSENGMTGSNTYEYLIIPRHAGDFTIPSLNFTYFNPKTKKYVSKSSQEFKVHIEKGDEITSGAPAVVSGISKEDVKYIGKDVRFIKTKMGELRSKGVYFFGSLWFYLSYLIVLVLFLIVFFLRRKWLKTHSDITLVKNKKANKYAQKRLKQASTHLKANNKDLFYEELAKALWGYLSDKLSIPLSELSRDKAAEVLLTKGVENELLESFNRIIDDCEFARFAPATDHAAMDKIYSESIEIISKLQQKLK